MNRVPYEQYKHLENICNIQHKYIYNEIKKKEFLKELDDENKRYMLELKKQNKKIRQEILFNKLSQDVKNILNENQGE